MHPEVATFLEQTRDLVPWDDALVLEVGAQDVNGPTRLLVPGEPRAWVGVDLVPGPGVDFVGDAAVILPEMVGLFDVAVSTEVLEHADNWQSIVAAMCDRLFDGGFLVITCAAPGRPPHGASGGEVADEWYENVSLARLMNVVEAAGCTVVLGMQSESFPQDTRLVARKDG